MSTFRFRTSTGSASLPIEIYPNAAVCQKSSNGKFKKGYLKYHNEFALQIEWHGESCLTCDENDRNIANCAINVNTTKEISVARFETISMFTTDQNSLGVQSNIIPKSKTFIGSIVNPKVPHDKRERYYILGQRIYHDR
jgi:hypothetical protein